MVSKTGAQQRNNWVVWALQISEELILKRLLVSHDQVLAYGA